MRTERAADGLGAVQGLLVHEPAGVLRHERIPFVSYPYEWTFSMLKDAALVQLDLLLAALEHDLVLKDSTPYNVQFRGARPLFVDIGSFERLREGEPWVGYRQFCMLYLYPLLLQSLKKVPVPALAARARSTASRRARCAGCSASATASARACSPTSSCTRGSSSATRDKPGQVKQEVQRGLQQGAVGRQRAQDAQAGGAALLGAAGGRVDRLRRAQQLHRRRREAQGRLRARGGPLPALGPGLGHRRATTAATRASRPRARAPWWRWTPTRARWSCSTATCVTRATSASSR